MYDDMSYLNGFGFLSGKEPAGELHVPHPRPPAGAGPQDEEPAEEGEAAHVAALGQPAAAGPRA